MKYVMQAVLGILLAAACSGNMHAQCQLIYNPNYAVYTTESTDGTHAFTAVLTDGSASMSVQGGCPDGIRNQIIQAINSATHTPQSYNAIGGSGGWGTGSSGCVSCYLSYQNNNTFTPTGANEYEFDWAGGVTCSVGGSIFNSSGSGFISLHRTTYKYSSISGGVCTYAVYCINSNHICGLDVITVQAPCAYTYFIAPFIKFRVGISSACFPIQGVLSNTWLACF